MPLVPVLVGTVGMSVSAYAGGAEALLVAFVFTTLAVLVWRVLDQPEGAVRDVAAGVFTAAYGPFLAGFAVLMLAETNGVWRIVTFILVAISSDIGGYVFGVLWGKHPMAPSVGPKKSWEGLGRIGRVQRGRRRLLRSRSSSTAPGTPASRSGGSPPWSPPPSATWSESLLKRDLGIKDMGGRSCPATAA